MIRLSDFQKLLVAFIAFVAGLILCRILYSGSFRFMFLLWNLFLAWVPFQLSLYLSHKRIIHRFQSATLIAAWLLFFPNALYIITDLIHLEAKTTVPVWFDAVLLFTAAVAGLMMAFASLYRVEKFFHQQFSKSVTNQIILLFLFMGSFGVYLGRFLRWNSWDIITDPIGLAREIVLRFVFPFQYYSTWAITALLTCLFSLLYFSIRKFTSGSASYTVEID